MQAKLGQESLMLMVRWGIWHWPPDTWFEIQTLEVWGRARYLFVTEDPHNTELYEWMGKKHFCFFQTADTGTRAPSSSVKGSGAINHYPKAPALLYACNQCTPIYQFNFEWTGKILISWIPGRGLNHPLHCRECRTAVANSQLTGNLKSKQVNP